MQLCKYQWTYHDIIFLELLVILLTFGEKKEKQREKRLIFNLPTIPWNLTEGITKHLLYN